MTLANNISVVDRPLALAVANRVAADGYYQDFGCVSNSMVSAFLENRQEYKAVYVDRSIPPDPPSEAMLFGSAFHALVLEPHQFAERWSGRKKISRRSNAGKLAHAEWQEVLARNGITELLPEDIKQLGAMGLALMANPIARRWLFGKKAEIERVIRWTCLATGMKRKAKLDWVSPEAKLVIDLKTCEDASPQAWVWQVGKYGLHRQASAYLEAVRHEYGPGDWTFLFLAVSKERFPRVGPHILEDSAIALGERENIRALTELQRCLASGDWSEPWNNSVNVVDLPRSAYFLEGR